MNSVDIVARASGFLREIAVSNGAAVEAGTPLFRIEPYAYEATFAQRQADLKGAQANLELADLDVERRRRLTERQVASQAELDVAEANNTAAQAQVLSAEAALSQAALNLSDTEIKAPFAGSIGRVQVSVGALVGPATGPLARLIQTAPMYVSFSIGANQMVELMERMEAGGERALTFDQLEVSVTLPDGRVLDEIGHVAFSENEINPRTGTITVRAEFANTRGLILNGAFLNVQIAAIEPEIKLLVPQAAVQRDAEGAFVLVVDDAQLVSQRHITVGATHGVSIIVEDGLAEGEVVIQQGLQRVQPGVRVDPVLATLDGPANLVVAPLDEGN